MYRIHIPCYFMQNRYVNRPCNRHGVGHVTVFWFVTPCNLVVIYRPRGWKHCSRSTRKFLQFGGRLWCGAGTGLPTASSVLARKSGRARGKVWKWKGQQSTQDGRWPQMSSTRPVTTKLHSIPARKTKLYATYSGPGPYSGFRGPGMLYRLPLSSRRYSALKSSIVLCCVCERPDWKQQLNTPQPRALLQFLAEILCWPLDCTTHIFTVPNARNRTCV